MSTTAKAFLELVYKDKASAGIKSTEKQYTKSLNAMKTAATSLLSAYVIREIITQTAALAELGATADIVQRSYRKLADEPDVMLEKMKAATAGTISEMKLMQKYNSAALLGLPLDRFDEMLMIARGSSQATGESMEYMLNSIVTGLGRGSKLMLDNLGILFDVGQANEEYAKSLEKTASQLTDTERKQAFINKALEVGARNLKRIGGVVESDADKFAQYRSKIENLSVSFGRLLLPLVGPLASGLGLVAESWANILAGAPGSDWWEGVASGMSRATTETGKLAMQGAGLERLKKQIEENKIGSLQWGDALEALGMDFGKLAETKETVIPALKNMIKLIEGSIGPMRKLAAEELAKQEEISKLKERNFVLKEGETIVRESHPLHKETAEYYEMETDALGYVIPLMIEYQALMDLDPPDHSNWISDTIEALGEWKGKIGGVTTAWSGLSSEWQKNLDARVNTEIAALKESEAYRNADAERRSDMENRIRKSYAAEETKIFRLNQVAALADIGFSTATAVMKAVKANPLTFGMPWSAIIGGMGMAQAGMVLSQEPPTYYVGGYTGEGDKYDPAGIVHRGEDVWSQEDIRRWGGINVVEQLRLNGPGYADGGPVGIPLHQVAPSAGGVIEIKLIGELKDFVEVSIAPPLENLASRNQIKLMVRD